MNIKNNYQVVAYRIINFALKKKTKQWCGAENRLTHVVGVSVRVCLRNGWHTQVGSSVEGLIKGPFIKVWETVGTVQGSGGW